MPILGLVGEIALMAAVGAVVGLVSKTFEDKASSSEKTGSQTCSDDCYFNEYEDEEIPKITSRHTL